MIRRIFTAVLALCLLPAASKAQAPMDGDSISVSVATVLASLVKNNIQSLELQGIDIDYDTFTRNFGKVLKGESTGISPEEANMYISNIMMNTAPRSSVDTVSVASQERFIKDVLESHPKAVRTDSGLVFITEKAGKGPMPSGDDHVMVRYTARLADGTIFDDTEEPVEFDLVRLIPGFIEGLKMMQQGGTYRMIIPSALGYGPQGIAGVIPGNAALDFTVTLDEIIPGK